MVWDAGVGLHSMTAHQNAVRYTDNAGVLQTFPKYVATIYVATLKHPMSNTVLILPRILRNVVCSTLPLHLTRSAHQ